MRPAREHQGANEGVETADTERSWAPTAGSTDAREKETGEETRVRTAVRRKEKPLLWAARRTEGRECG
ncbi:hypothetical protein BDY21DRAFT_340876 [Lineolata rhizophorae]|uniref:Uncharacterized protein n=1 Tax=Lineolata rhizophorae TaxID=578093 RepID=A0A6A6P5D5_9PEZI|nr:hypothetical protein BDY21DRAFT_340876 [Lineolata rhizophorae]